MIVVESAGITDVGKKRKGNEDALFYDDALGLYVVADGMGGHNAGEVASQIVAETLGSQVQRFADGLDAEKVLTDDNGLSDAACWLNTAIHMANRKVFDRSQSDPACKGMGSTVSALLLTGEKVVVGNVGDSPIYLVRDGDITLISVMHTMMAEYEAMAPSGAKNLSEQFRHMITRAMGIEKTVQPDVSEMACRKNDRFVISSDGLTDMVETDQILNIVTNAPTQAACRALVDQANANGGRDNITVIVLKIVDVGGKAGRPSAKTEPAPADPSAKTQSRLPVHIDTDDASFSAYLHHIDLAGAFVETSDPFAPGSEIYLTVSDPDGQNPFMIIATVKQRRSLGIQVTFGNLTEKKKRMIKALRDKL